MCVTGSRLQLLADDAGGSGTTREVWGLEPDGLFSGRKSFAGRVGGTKTTAPALLSVWLQSKQLGPCKLPAPAEEKERNKNQKAKKGESN